ncbi:MAG: hypothetical protein HC933_02530 [Pleurocapsa sp. SU_196_0]|nr:hypothetical protein [Pleurocapsa sp. SU_196_0]
MNWRVLFVSGAVLTFSSSLNSTAQQSQSCAAPRVPSRSTSGWATGEVFDFTGGTKGVLAAGIASSRS